MRLANSGWLREVWLVRRKTRGVATRGTACSAMYSNGNHLPPRSSKHVVRKSFEAPLRLCFVSPDTLLHSLA